MCCWVWAEPSGWEDLPGDFAEGGGKTESRLWLLCIPLVNELSASLPTCNSERPAAWEPVLASVVRVHLQNVNRIFPPRGINASDCLLLLCLLLRAFVAHNRFLHLTPNS